MLGISHEPVQNRKLCAPVFHSPGDQKQCLLPCYTELIATATDEVDLELDFDCSFRQRLEVYSIVLSRLK